jgi:hypothetical protein
MSPRQTYERDPRVDDYIDALPQWQQDICRQLRDLIHAAEPEIAETIKRRVRPYFVLQGNVCALLATKDHVSLFLYDGAIVPDPEGIMPLRPHPPARIDAATASRGHRRRAVLLGYESSAEIQPAIARLSFEQRLVLLSLTRPEEVDNAVPARMQKLRDQAPVATPPECLRTHEAGRRLRERRGKRRLPAFAAHASGIAAEGGHAEAAEGVLARFTGQAATELDRMPVANPTLLEHRSERRLVELRVVTRAWKAANIDERADAGFADNRYELFHRTCAVPDRPDDHPHQDADLIDLPRRLRRLQALGNDADATPKICPHPRNRASPPDLVRSYRWQLTPGEDAIDTATWAGSIPQVNGIAPRVRVGRTRWFTSRGRPIFCVVPISGGTPAPA